MARFHRSQYSLLILFTVLVSIPTDGFGLDAWIQQARSSTENLQVHDKAPIIVLHNERDVEFNSDGSNEAEVKIAYYIINSDYADEAVVSELKSKWRSINGLKGWLIKPSGDITKLKKKDIYEVSIDRELGYYSNEMALLAGFDSPEGGDIIAFEYTIKEKDFWGSLFQHFQVQKQFPVVRAVLKVEYPDDWEVIVSYKNIEGNPAQVSDGSTVWIYSNLPYREEEPLMPSWNYLERAIHVATYDPEDMSGNHFQNWNDVARWTDRIMLNGISDDQQLLDYYQQHFDTIPDIRNKIGAIADFVREDIRYVAVELDKGRFEPRPAGKTIANRFGDCKDKVALMRKFLELADIKTSAVLISVNSYINPELPSPFQFNHCILGVNLNNNPSLAIFTNPTDGNWFLYDPTHPTTSYGYLPVQLFGGYFLVGNNDEIELRKVPLYEPQENHRLFAVEGNLSAEGTVTAEVRITDYGYKAHNEFTFIGKLPDEKLYDYVHSNFTDQLPGADISNVAYDHTADSSTISFSLVKMNYLQDLGGMKLININLLRKGTLPKLPDTQREHPIWLGPTEEIEYKIHWTLDSSLVPEISADSSEYDNNGMFVTGRLHYNDNKIEQYVKIEKTGEILPVDVYENVRTFQKTVARVVNYKMILQTKIEE